MRLEEVDKIVAEVYKEILHKIGTIHSENVFQNAFAFGLCERGIQNIKEYPVPVFFNNEYVGEKRIDILIIYYDDDNKKQKYILELKAKKHYKEHERQIKGYDFALESAGQALINLYEGWVEYLHQNNLKMQVTFEKQEQNDVEINIPFKDYGKKKKDPTFLGEANE
jgi:hypothetical protein